MTDTVFIIYRQVFIDAWELFSKYKHITYEDNKAWEQLGYEAEQLLKKYKGLEFAVKFFYEVMQALENHAKSTDQIFLKQILGEEHNEKYPE